MWLPVKMRIKLENFLLDFFDMLSFLVFVLWIVLFIRFFVANPYTVVWSSMAPTFIERDFIKTFSENPDNEQYLRNLEI